MRSNSRVHCIACTSCPCPDRQCRLLHQACYLQFEQQTHASLRLSRDSVFRCRSCAPSACGTGIQAFRRCLQRTKGRRTARLPRACGECGIKTQVTTQHAIKLSSQEHKLLMHSITTTLRCPEVHAGTASVWLPADATTTRSTKGAVHAPCSHNCMAGAQQVAAMDPLWPGPVHRQPCHCLLRT
jgi:hypothetical protein